VNLVPLYIINEHPLIVNDLKCVGRSNFEEDREVRFDNKDILNVKCYILVRGWSLFMGGWCFEVIVVH
jgi:hypothetical protein